MNVEKTIRIIRTEQQHLSYLEEVEHLLNLMPEVGSEEDERLEVLSVLIDDYENKNYAIEPVDPVDAIKFRMQELNLKQVDLAPYFGTKSRVSEVLSRKRPLTVQMIKLLSIGLGISADTLVGLDVDNHYSVKAEVNWSNFPIKEMVSRGWIKSIANKSKKSTENRVREFIDQLGHTPNCAAFKRTLKGESYSPSTQYAIYAWLTRVVQKARDKKSELGKFDESILNNKFLKEVAQLSWFERGPSLAIEYLEKQGICVVIVPQLKGTLIDGAALKDEDEQPIIALTLRHNRLDNFWFTLIHEIVHIWKHVRTNETFIDDIEHSTEDKMEAEANRIARDTFIPRANWKRSDAYINPSKETIGQLSKELKIHPAIIAGRIRRESGNYNQFSDLIGQGEVRQHFPQKTENEV